MNIEWNKVTRYSQVLAIILFVGTFFLGFWLGTIKVEETNVHKSNLGYTNNVPEEKGNEIQITERHTERTTGNESTSPEYKIVSPKAGDVFYEGDWVTMQAKNNDSTGRLDIYMLSSKCSNENEFCDDGTTGFPDRTLKGYLEKGTTTSEINLGYSRYVAYPEGEYRIILIQEREGPQPILAVSDPFTILPPLDTSRVWIGGKLGDFTVSDIRLDAYLIETVGTTTVRGSITDGYYDSVCFDVIDDDLHKLPRYGPDDDTGDFCFFNDLSEEFLNTKGTTTIQIANYVIDERGKDGVTDSADFVQIIK